MNRLISALLTAALAVVFFGLGSVVTASDPVPSTSNHPTSRVSFTSNDPPPQIPSADSPLPQKPRPGATIAFTATAYCQRGTTRSGVNTHQGIAAADPAQLPVGSVVHVETDLHKYNGVYTVLDTGGKVVGHHVDLFMHDCGEARHFGRQQAKVTVLRKGWSPKGSTVR